MVRALKLGALLALAATACRRPTAFERQNADARRATPDLQVQLRTADGRTAFHRFEPIVVEVSISSSRFGQYAIEMAEGMNAAPGEYGWHFDQPQKVLHAPFQLLGIFGFGCCDSVRPLIGTVPAR